MEKSLLDQGRPMSSWHGSRFLCLCGRLRFLAPALCQQPEKEATFSLLFKEPTNSKRQKFLAGEDHGSPIVEKYPTLGMAGHRVRQR